MMFYKSRPSKGFTLIELLVVIAIIGILSSVVLASLNSARLKSRDARRLADIKQIQNALTLYFDSAGAYPTTTAALVPTYIAAIPTDPLPANGAYAYAATGADPNVCTGYHLAAILEEPNAKVLTEDIDDDGTATICTGSNANFHGNADGCTGTTAGASDQCYDTKQ